MKRILLSLAALAALASCVKENTLAPAADQLTISAVSADTKTTLDGLNVVWEKTDKIAVVVNANEKVTAEFDIVESTLAGSAADFVGTMEWAKGSATSAYAVYPAAAVELTHTLPAAQTGDVSGLMLSAAALEVEDMQKGAATAEFHPALSLLQVAVPAGVKSVELTSAGAALVGDATFEVDPATGAVTLTVADGATKTVSISAEEELEAKTYPVVVYPGEVGDLTLKLVGAKGETFEKTVSGITFVAAEARAINLMQIFEFAPAAMEVAANGGTIELPFTTTVEKITVTENADWLESAVAVKGFQTGNVTLVAAANEGEEARTAEVTVSWGEGKSVSFTLTQPAIYRGFLGVKWEETFGVYTSESDANAANVANAAATHKNVFTIELSDDYSKGTYLVSNIFKATSYYDNNSQAVYGKGGQYYANYKDGEFTLLYANAVKSYGFTTDVTISYDETTNTFSAATFKAYDYSVYRDRYIGGYAAVVKVEEPEVGGSFDVTLLYGTYNESVKAPYSYGNTETLVVSASDDPSYDLSMLFFYTEGDSSYSYEKAYGKVSADGKTITVSMPNGTSNFYGPVSEFTLSFEDGVISGSYCGKMDYSAENPNYVAPAPEPTFDVTSLYGTYNESVKAPYSYGNTETLVVSASDDPSYDLSMLFFYTEGDSSYSYEKAYGKVSADGKTITVSMPNGTSNFYGPVSEFTLSFEDGVISGSYCGKMDYSAENPNYVAPGAGTEPEEPEVPEVGGPTLDGVWNQSVTGMSWPSPSATMTIAVNGSTVTITDFIVAGTVAEGTIEGNVITIPAGVNIGAGSNQAGPLDAAVALTISDDYNTITAAPFSIAGWVNVSAYSAEKQEKNEGTVTPEPEVPADPWENAAVAVNGAEATDDTRLKELRAYADAENLYIRLTATNETPFGANYLDYFFTDGEGETAVWWGWTTTGTDIYYQEHKCELDADGNLTKMRWYTDPETRVYVDSYTTEIADTEVIWTITIPREYVDVYKSSTNTVHMSFLLWNGWDDYWAIPARGTAMLEVVLP